MLIHVKRGYSNVTIVYTYCLIHPTWLLLVAKFRVWNFIHAILFFSPTSKSKSNPSLWRAGFTIALHCQGKPCPSSLRIGLGFCQIWSLSTSWTQKWSPGWYLGTSLGELQHHIVAQVAVLNFEKAWTIHMTRHSHTLLLQTN
jgi:hypothetical protein